MINQAIQRITGTDQFKTTWSPTGHALTIKFDGELRADNDAAILSLVHFFTKLDVVIFLVDSHSLKVSAANAEKHLS